MSDAGDSALDFANRYQDAAARLLALVEAACASRREWPSGVRLAVRSALSLLSSEPALARLLLFEPYDAGPVAQARHEATLARIGALLRRGREWAGAEEEIPELVEESLVGAFVFIAGRPLRRGTPEDLPALAPELTALLLTPYLGREEAERVARERGGRGPGSLPPLPH